MRDVVAGKGHGDAHQCVMLCHLECDAHVSSAAAVAAVVAAASDVHGRGGGGGCGDGGDGLPVEGAAHCCRAAVAASCHFAPAQCRARGRPLCLWVVHL